MMVLVVEDNTHLATNIIEYLEEEGFECDYAMRGEQAIDLALTTSFDVVVLDLMLPGISGIEVCRELKSRGVGTAILMLTAKDTLEDKLEGFHVGADDYLVKPFDMPELVARIRAVSSREKIATGRLTLSDLVVDIESHEVTRGATPIHLNPTCWQLLVLLMKASPRVMERAELERQLWGDNPPESDSLKSHIYHLRRAIDRDFEPPLLHTLRGVGFVMRESNVGAE